MKYYVVTTYSGFENKVKIALEDRIRAEGMADHFGELLVPTETVQEVVRGKKRISERKFFPGYVFVEMNMTDETWHLVKSTPKVTGFVGNQTPTPVPDAEIQSIQNRIQTGASAPTPIIRFEEGDGVRVIDGAFNGFNGTVEVVKSEKQKVVVLVSIFGRATPVELDYTQVEKLG
ncbi:MAG: transcription termination/antitermination protein NusG [Proteobacteria bacterium]|jgi:transcriptional antiterminator NusG|nr:transcription termination/antitermination protein NusG [Pseudomonadota bacterium]